MLMQASGCIQALRALLKTGEERALPAWQRGEAAADAPGYAKI
jgi:hypothetical protein